MELTQADFDAAIERATHAAIEKAMKPLNEKMTDWQARLLGQQKDQPNPDIVRHNGKDIDVRFGRMMRCMAAGRGNVRDAAEYAKNKFGAENFVTKTLVSNLMGSGGAFVPEDLLPNVIEYLRPQSGIRRINPTIYPNPSGNLHVPKLIAGASASYRGEASDNNSQTPSTGDVVLTHKILDIIIPISKELLLTSGPAVDAVITMDATAAMAQKEDASFIRGAGTLYAPKGLKYLCPAANSSAATATSGADAQASAIRTDISGLESTLASANVNLNMGAYLMSRRSFIALRDLRNTNGFLYYPSMSEGSFDSPTREGMPKLNNYPVSVTNNIPVTMLSGADTGGTDTEMYFVNASDIVIGEMTQLEIEMSMEAAYKTSAGTLVSAFTRGELVIKLTARHDIGLRHDESIAMNTAVKY